jgi:hypothetical protein
MAGMMNMEALIGTSYELRRFAYTILCPLPDRDLVRLHKNMKAYNYTLIPRCMGSERRFYSANILDTTNSNFEELLRLLSRRTRGDIRHTRKAQRNKCYL